MSQCLQQGKCILSSYNFVFCFVCDKYSHMLTYLRSYAANFDLEKYIKYDRDVTLVEPAADYDSTGRWTVAVKDRKSGEVKTSTFDAVLV